MIYNFKTNDEKAAKRFIKANDMAAFIWDLQHNFWRKWKQNESDFTLDNYRQELADLLNEYNIDIDDLIDIDIDDLSE